MSPTFFLFIILTITMLFEAFYIWWKNPKNPVNYLYGLSMILLSTWPLVFVLIFTLSDYAVVSFLDNFIYGVFALFVALLMPLTILFPSGTGFTKKQKVLTTIISLLGLFFFIASFFDLVTGPLDPNWKINGPAPGPLIAPFLLFVLITILISGGYVIYHYRRAVGIEKRQIFLALSGFLLTVSAAATVGGILPLLFEVNQYGIFGPFAIIFLVTFLGWAILKHHLFDIRILASEIFAYILVLILLLPLFGPYVNFPNFLGKILIAVLGAIISLFFIRATINEKEKTKEILNLNQLIAAQNSRNEALLESINDGVFAVDLEYKIILFNHRAEILSGYRRDEVLGKKFSDFIHFLNEKNGEERIALIEEVIKTGNPAKLEKNVVLRQKNGRLLPVGDSVSPVRNQNNKVIGAIIVFRDVEEERLVEQMKDEFISIAAHELRDPMTAMKGFVSMLLGGDLGKVSKAQNDVLQMIASGTERLLKLVTDMLNTARIDAGKMRFDLEKLPLGLIVQEAAQFYAGQAKSKHLKFKFIEPETNIYRTQVLIDKDKIFQALSNVISNAIKFTQKGSVAISMKKDKNFLIITISDTGSGIPEKDQRWLFQKFSRGKNVDKAGLLGSGLGLYIAKKLIEKHGGDLWLVNSEINKGSTFALSVPMLGTPEQKKAAEILAAETKMQKQKSFVKMQI